ncbi:hypothetical protein BUALT_Bualt07G0160200 [Buddleja alternifolia]|uniref:Uncharacterized protein n=1 Tax=Buddleja alternifolia TaxID=168488 RepID=A0AAV6XHW5_9LAMI|nr:hypothetical protein BUALT_Bualt07G0160200 [Buddleja alternifolia]
MRLGIRGYDRDDGKLVPPHVIIGWRVTGKMMVFSVCTGNGRTLKGRDLSERERRLGVKSKPKSSAAIDLTPKAWLLRCRIINLPFCIRLSLGF